VNDLAPLLSLTTLVYRFTPTSTATPHMFSGAAQPTGDIPRHSKAPSSDLWQVLSDHTPTLRSLLTI
ncbi:MAG: hypothetical protein Q9198_010396, partial [Flavoplaca austrocitrina]